LSRKKKGAFRRLNLQFCFGLESSVNNEIIPAGIIDPTSKAPAWAKYLGWTATNDIIKIKRVRATKYRSRFFTDTLPSFLC